jgi:hypothetical protein
MVDRLPEPKRSRRIEECEVYGVDLDEVDHGTFTVTAARPTTWVDRFDGLRDWLQQWVIPDRLPDGYRVDPGPLARVWLAHRAHAAQLAAAEQAGEAVAQAVRDALDAGEPAVRVGDLLGVVRQRVYQLRDGTR